MSATMQDGFQREVLAGLQRIGTRLDAVEVRLDKIEGRLDKIEDRLDKVDVGQHVLEVAIAELKGRVSQVPTTFQMLGFVPAVIAITGLVRIYAP